MKLSLSALGATCVIALALYACADSEESTATPVDNGDGSALPPVNDAGIDVPVDAATEADVVAPAKVCSDSQLCHLSLPVKENLVGVWADGAGVVWSVTTQGSILRHDAAGGWKVHASGLGALVAIWGSSPTDIWAVGEKGAYHSTGAAFTPSTLPGAFPTKLTSLWGSAANDVWVTGDTENAQGDPVNVVLRFNGTGWAKVTVPTGRTYYRVWGHATSGVWLAGSRFLPPPDEFTSVTDVLRRAPGASSFTKVTLPESPRFPESPGLNALREVRGAVAPNGTTMWIHAISVASYPAVIKGTSANNGVSFAWTYDESAAITSNPEYNAIFSVDANDGWAVGEWGQVRRWDGTTWKPQAVTLTHLPVVNELNAIWATTDRAYIVGDGIAIEWRKP